MHYWRINLGILLLVAVATAIITGALITGDSVKYSLKKIMLSRIGRTEYALHGEERFFRDELADDIVESLDIDTASVMQLKGIAIKDGGEQSVNRVQILGVDKRFWSFSTGTAEFSILNEDEAVVNDRLAGKLGLHKGDMILLRIDNPSLLARDAPFSSDEDSSVTLRLNIKAIISSGKFGDFSLKMNHIVPSTVFIPLSVLNKKVELPFRANIILASAKQHRKINIEQINQALKNNWQMADAGLELRSNSELKYIELLSRRVFIDEKVEEAAMQADKYAKKVFSYFVNSIKAGRRSTPYSFVSAPGRPLVKDNMGDNEIIINKWLASDLGIKRGDIIELNYYIVDPMRNLKEAASKFKVHSVIPIKGYSADKYLMPKFPGLVDTDSCRDWSPGIPVDLDEIRDKDEKYWDLHKGTPKAFVTLSSAKRMWKNQFGGLTAVRYPLNRDIKKLASEIMKRLTPASMGFSFMPVQEQALKAGRGSNDFGQLFIGLSFFIVISALLLLGLAFVFSIDNRADQTGSLLALGFYPSYIKKLFLTEGFILALLGSIPGVVLGAFYNWFILYGLSTIWQGAIGSTTLYTHIKFSTLLIGAFSGISISILAIYLTVQKQIKGSVVNLHQAESKSPFLSTRSGKKYSLAVTAAGGLSILIILIFVNPIKSINAAVLFFTAGSLLLISSLAGANLFFSKISEGDTLRKMNMAVLGLRNSIRRRGRSLTVVGILAVGVFLVIAVSANRQDVRKRGYLRSSGTGGFSLFGETTMPILKSLNTEEGQKQFGLEGKFSNVKFVEMRMLEGDDASCLNLNYVEKPRILGVDPKEFASRGAFTFVGLDKKYSKERGNPWMLLDKEMDKDIIPAIADNTVIMWSLGKSIGDTLSYKDERGEEIKIKLVGALANSVFQGNILISQKFFLKHFPSVNGSRIFLADVPGKILGSVKRDLIHALQDVGLDLTTATGRLEKFNVVQNTYLSIFLILGAFGIIIGTVGMGIVILRNVIERRGELALLRAVGFPRKAISGILFYENWLLFVMGLVIGLACGILAVLPNIISSGVKLPYGLLIIIIGSMVLSGGLWIYSASIFATKGDLLGALRKE